jgi:hypothetical protein
MRRLILASFAAGLTCLAVTPAAAQEQGPGPRKVLHIIREEIKPARGAAHERAEEAYARAFRAAKLPVYYVGLRSLTGPPEAWFISAYDSHAAWEQENDAVEKNASLSRQLERADDADAAFRTGQRNIVLELDEDLSYRMRPSMQDMRYLDVTVMRIRPGHMQTFREIRKTAKEAHEKAGIDEHWALYTVNSGMPAGTVLLLSGSMSMKEFDTDPHTPAYRDAIGDEGRKKNQQFQREGLISVETMTFALAPKMSNVPDAWIKARPDFWKAPAVEKITMAPAASAPAKPSAQ